VQLRAETEGRVTEIKAKKGQRVSQGDVILVLALNDRRAKLEEAEAKVRHLDARLEATRKLQTKGYADEVTIMEIEASLASARAELKDIEIDIAHTRITAPFDGIVNDRDMEEGDYVRVGDVVANIVDDNTLLASGYLPQQSIGKIRVGQPAKARVFTGEELEGTVTYISALSGNESRTYRVELEIPNPKHLLTAGVSTMITLSAGASEGHFISPSALSLGGEEQLGVKVVGNDNRVIFYPVDIVRTEMNGIWVSGLPSRINLITLGQGFVNAGEEVIPVTRVAAESTSATVTL
jgi:multidrug efflux system membrane fusion protein